jgi:Sec7-like guanine-nucleotide exchange factor
VNDHTWIIAQSRVQLSVSYVYGPNTKRTVLEQNVGKSASARTHIKAHTTSWIDAQHIKHTREFEPSARNIRTSVTLYFNDDIIGNRCTCFIDTLTTDKYFSGHEQCLCALATFSESTSYHYAVDAFARHCVA